MALDNAQLATLRTALLADTDPAVAAAVSARNDTEVARLYKLDSAFWVWRTSIPAEEYREAIVWTEVDGLQVGKARIWEWVTAQMTMPLDASKANVRQGLADCWSAQSSTRPALLAIAKRFANKAEAVFATGTGTEANPGTLTFEGEITIEDVGRALNG